MKLGTKVMAVVAVAFLAVGGEALAAKKGATKKLVGVANLNAATAKELDLLPGVGEKAARAIVEQRVKAPFHRVEELAQVKGFGKKKIDRLRPFLTVNGPTTLRLAPVDTHPPLSQGRAPARR